MAAETPNFKLKKPDRTDFVNIKEQLSDNMDIIDTEIKAAKEKADKAFQSASNGKTLIKNAITGVDPEVTIPSDATFAQLATAIGQIETGVNTDDATATAEKILAGMTAYVKGIKVTGTMPNRLGGDNVPAVNAGISGGSLYLTPPSGNAFNGGAVYQPEPNLVSTNIRANTSIFGMQGNSNVVDTSDGTIDAGKILTGYGGYSKGVKYNGSMPNIGQQIITPSTANQNIAAGYHNGVGYVKGDANLIPANILSGKSIFGVTGSVISGMRYASGTTQVPLDNKRFYRDKGSQISYPYLQVSNLNLGFTPRLMFYHLSSNRYYKYFYFRDGFGYMGSNYPVMQFLGDEAPTSYSSVEAPHEYLFARVTGDFTWYAWE